MIKKGFLNLRMRSLLVESRLLIVIKQESCVLKVRKTVLNLRNDWMIDFCVVEKFSNQ